MIQFLVSSILALGALIGVGKFLARTGHYDRPTLYMDRTRDTTWVSYTSKKAPPICWHWTGTKWVRIRKDQK